ncbi:MAG: nucleoside-triphosphatase [Sulfolobales archaeon]
MEELTVKVLITGRPGVGKSTVFMKVVEGLRTRGYKVCGFYCPEIRVGRVRKGFKIVSIGLPLEGVLSYVCGEMSGLSSISVGKYCVKADDAVLVGVRSLEYAERECDFVAIDEVGPMELKVVELREKIWSTLYGPKPAIAVVHARLAEEVKKLFASKSFRTLYFMVTEVNRDRLPQTVLSSVFSPPQP